MANSTSNTSSGKPVTIMVNGKKTTVNETSPGLFGKLGYTYVDSGSSSAPKVSSSTPVKTSSSSSSKKSSSTPTVSNTSINRSSSSSSSQPVQGILPAPASAPRYTFKELPTGKVDIFDNGKSISQGGPGFDASYAASLGYKPTIQLTTDPKKNQEILSPYFQNQGQGLVPTPQTYSPTNPATFPGLVNSLANNSLAGSPIANKSANQLNTLGGSNPGTSGKAYDDYIKAVEEYKRLRSDIAKMEGNIESQPIPLNFQQGRKQVLARQNASLLEAAQQKINSTQNAITQQISGNQAQQAALTSAGNMGIAGQGQLQSGLTSAAGFGAPSGTYPFVFNPLTGSFGGGATGFGSPDVTASQYAREVIAGVRTYNDAVQAMSVYGASGKQFLDQAIRMVQPQFNFSQAQALADVQGNVSPALNMAQSALMNLQATFSSTPEWQRTSVPILNSLANMLGAVGIGTGTATSKANAINEARTQVANALGVMTNTTPTSWSAMVSQWFPDNATPDQVAAGVQQFNNLAKSRQSIFGAPGVVQPFNPSQTYGSQPSSNSQYGW